MSNYAKKVKAKRAADVTIHRKIALKKGKDSLTLVKIKRTLNSMGELSDQQRKATVCALVGHSRIQTVCFGYYNCARCGEQVGDSLASIYPGAERAVIVGHDCDICRKNFEECTWRDKYLAPNPFEKPE